jgi:hypothetical protein
MSGISLGKAIFYILSGDTTLDSYVGDKIYPIFAPDEVLNPFVAYNTRVSNSFYTKDGLTYDECVLNINIVSDNYTENKQISEAVRNALEFKVGNFNGVIVQQALLSSVNEDYGRDGFITTIEFTYKVK